MGEREAYDRLFQWSETLLRPPIRHIVRDPAADLGAHVSRAGQRILKALEALAEK